MCRTELNFKRKYEGPPPNYAEKRMKFGNVRAVVAEENTVDEQEEPESFIFNIGDGDEYLWARVGGVLVQVLIDSGSSKNIIDDTTWQYMKQHNVKSCVPAYVPKTVLRGYGPNAQPLEIMHIFEAISVLCYQRRTTTITRQRNGKMSWSAKNWTTGSWKFN